jgi:hypothetical protein
MFHGLVDGLMMGAAAGAASSWARRKMTSRQTPIIWTGECNGTTLDLMEMTYHGSVYYELFVISDGEWRSVGRSPSYPQLLTLVQQWQAYLAAGGTVRAWREQAWADQPTELARREVPAIENYRDDKGDLPTDPVVIGGNPGI